MRRKSLAVLAIIAIMMNVAACSSPSDEDSRIELLSIKIEELQETIGELKIDIEELQAENEEIKTAIITATTPEITDQTCKEPSCTEIAIYQDGYCKFHYYSNVGESVLKDFLNN